VLVALVGTFVWGYFRASGRPPTAFQYVPRALGANDLVELKGGSAGVALGLRGRIRRLTIDAVGWSRDLMISLPLAGCSNALATGRPKCHPKHVDVGQAPVTLVWSQPVEFCIDRDVGSLSLSGDPTLGRGLFVSVGSRHAPAGHSSQRGGCLAQSGSGDMCFQTLPIPPSHLTIIGARRAVWSFKTPAVPPSCAAGLKLLVEPDQIGSTADFGLPAKSFRLIASAPTGVFRSSAASVLTPAGRVALDPGDSIQVRRARGLCLVVISGQGSPAPLSPSEAKCQTYSLSLEKGLYISAPAVVSATRELRALNGPGEQLVKSRYQQDPALWLALLGAYLTVVVTLVPTLGHRAYVEVWRAWAALRPKKPGKRPTKKKRGGLS
jgi:hypothetical protein